MFNNKYFNFFKKLTSPLAICVGILTQNTIVNGGEPHDHIDAYKIQEVIKSLHDNNRQHNSPLIIADIYKDLSIIFSNVSSIDPTLQCFKDFRSFLRDRATNNPQLIGTAGRFSFISDYFIEIEIFSTTLLENLKHDFNLLGIPVLEKIELAQETDSQFSFIKEVAMGTYYIIADDEKVALYTRDLYDCIGIVAQGIDINSRKLSLLGHFHRGCKVDHFIKVLENNFDAKKTSISLISSKYTPHLLEITMQLKNTDFIIKGYHIGNAYNCFMDKNPPMNVWPSTFKKINLAPRSVLIIPGDENVYFTNEKNGRMAILRESVSEAPINFNFINGRIPTLEENMLSIFIREHPYFAPIITSVSLGLVGIAIYEWYNMIVK